MRQFCDTPFWDLNAVWYTNTPDITPCFQKTVLVWTPCALLWVTATIDIWISKPSRISPLPLSALNVVKLIQTLVLLAVHLADLVMCILQEFQGDSPPVSEYLSPSIQIATYMLVFSLQRRDIVRGQRSSDKLFVFWFLFSIVNLIFVYSSFTRTFNEIAAPDSLRNFAITVMAACFVFSQLVLSTVNEKISSLKKERLGYHEQPVLIRILFIWVDRLIWFGYRHKISIEDLEYFPEFLKSKNVWQRFDSKWKAQSRSDNRSTEPKQDFEDTTSHNQSLPWTLFLSFWRNFLVCVTLEFCSNIIKMGPPILLGYIIEFVSSNEPVWKGYIYAVVLLSLTFGSKVLQVNSMQWNLFFCIKLKNSLIAAIYRKALKISNAVRRDHTIGELVNLLVIDVEKTVQLGLSINTIWSAPMKMILTVILLWSNLGPSTLAGIAIMLTMIPITAVVSRKALGIQVKQMAQKDLRMKHVNEMLNGIKILKLYAWEIPFIGQVSNIRRKEIGLLRKYYFLDAALIFSWTCVPLLMAVASFVTFVLVDERNILTPSIAFVSLSLFNMLRHALNSMPELISNIIQSKVSIGRLKNFLNSEELSPNRIGKTPSKGSCVSIENGTLTWSLEDEPVLKDINLEIPNGQLVAIVGQVATGKSSLISALLGDLYKLSGEVNIKGSTAYVPQQAWILNATLRQNIQFITPMNESFYQKVLDACCLRPDLEMLIGGDLTEIGEKGINLSGGQKQRVSLARAIYHNADIYLLDDPLSAVDSHVGRHLFKYVIGPEGLLKNKTRILVTHNISVLSEVDIILVMKDGKIHDKGTFKELRDRESLPKEYFTMDDSSEEEVYEDEEIDFEDSCTLSQDIEICDGQEEFWTSDIHQRRSSKALLSRQTSQESRRSFSRQNSEVSRNVYNRQTSKLSRKSSRQSSRSKEEDALKDKAKLTQKEFMEEGQVKGAVYIKYFKNASFKLLMSTFMSYISYQGFDVAASFWLSAWSEDGALSDGTQDIPLRNRRIVGYAGLGAGKACCVLLAALLMAFASTRASELFHQKLLMAVLRSPMMFFDTTPMGRLLNRFGKDVDVIDSQVPRRIENWFINFLSVAGTCVIISISNPIFVVGLIPLCVVYYYLQRFYVVVSRQCRRLESITRSPLYSHFSESLQGVQSIRAYQAESNYTSIADGIEDTNMKCNYNMLLVNRWLGIRLEVLGCLVILGTSIMAIEGRHIIHAGIVGLTLSYSLSVTDALSNFIRISTQLEISLVSVERVEEYCNLKPEAPWEIVAKKPNLLWPEVGQINFNSYSTRYREGLQLVLKSVNLTVKPGEKVGIVGRTGAGKSSLTLALFRIIEPVDGTIEIDDVDTKDIGLHDLRSKLTIIPQDPVLFTGTLRMNLDPNCQYLDDEIWTALDHAHLKEFVVSLPKGLHHQVAEGGENLSVGQRQLVCLARALLKRTKILVLDEATAAVDMETDALIQNTIRSKFVGCTVVTIAHRIHTILDSNRVVVMDEGKVIEVGSPDELLENQSSKFYAMAKDAGLV